MAIQKIVRIQLINNKYGKRFFSFKAKLIPPKNNTIAKSAKIGFIRNKFSIVWIVKYLNKIPMKTLVTTKTKNSVLFLIISTQVVNNV